ncbi:MAG TPA: type II CAAX endopeptidase family protein [Terracidiphilus sp.]|nr:type II CAAX endopeptidase family protein [Terracidiphilus sp.]
MQFPPQLSHWTTILAAVLAFAPVLAFGFCGAALERISKLPRALQIALPVVLAIPYLLASLPFGWFRWEWFRLYALLPVVVAWLLSMVARRDREQRGHWLEFIVLLALGLAVDLRWFEGAWPRGLAFMNKLLLLDAGLYGFMGVRALSGVGFDLRLKGRDWKIGLREWLFYTPIAIALGLALGFLHWHRHIDRPWMIPLAWLFTFFLIALPEEIYFRGWMQNLLERKIGRTASLLLTAVIFGLSHFNKRTAFFNWRYVLLAAIAGIFYGRAWRAERRIGASAITHTTVDTLWGALLR